MTLVRTEWTVERYEPSLAEVWDELARSARQRHFLFERGYMDYHADRFADCSLVLVHRGEPAAALPLSRHGDEAVSHGGLTFGGLLSSPTLTTAKTIAALDAAADALRLTGFDRLVYKPVPHPYHVHPAEEDLAWLASRRAILVRRDISAARRGGDAPPYSAERRRAVSKGLTARLEIGPSDAIEEFMAFERDVLLARHGAEPVHTAAELRLLADRFPEGIRLFTARHDGELVAGVVMYETSRVAHAQYIGASETGRQLRAGDALFDHLLGTVYADHPWFDFGISNERDGSINHGLLRNKEGFGARALVYDRWLVDLR
jgi:hypothetical protein